ncbi:MAG: CotH kinase family protein [Paludibacteraceae bacterium]|nr:CotH kinase family protein [Paludibacteraceae bacterium]
MKRLFQILILFSCFSNAGAAVRITEIMPSNVSTIVSDKYNYDGYIEFYNDGEELDLKGWTVSNVKEGELDWSLTLDSSHVLPNGYSLLFFGEEESSSMSAKLVGSNYAGSVKEKLTADAGSVSLSKGEETIEFAYPKQYPHIAYCEEGFMIPTPGKDNDPLVTSISNRVAKPAFASNKPGMYEEGLSVELSCATAGAQIYYTLNGDAPTMETGTKYEGAFSVDKTTVVRARAYKDGMLFSEILTGSFIYSDKFYDACKGAGERLPIVSLSVNNVDMFSDSLGIYVEGTNGVPGSCYRELYNFNRDWTRSANFEYMLNGKVVDNQEVEIGVYGGCTRIHVAKSLKIKANKRSGNSKMKYDNFFPSREYKKYESLALRNGGNGYSYVQPRWRDMFIQSLTEGMNLDVQVAQPVSFYLNGAFYGMMILTERTNEDYVEHNYGLKKEEIDFMSVSAGYGYQCEAGTREAYDEMIDYASNNYESEDFYDELNTMMDIDEYVDYQIIEQYVGNTDWVSNNTKLWRKHDGGRFRWILFDTDFGLSKATSVDKDMIKFATSEKGNAPMWALLKSCLKNEDFRWKFLDQYLDRLENQFTDERIDTKLDSIWNLTRLDMCATIKNSGFLGAPGNQDEFDEIVEEMRNFAKVRKGYVVDQLKKEFGLGDDSVTIKIRPVFPNSETPDFKFLLNKREVKSLKYNTWRYSGERVKVEPIVPDGYKIRMWAINDSVVRLENGSKYIGDVMAAVATSDVLKFSIYFEHDTDFVVPAALYLNEVCASNQTVEDELGETPDWIEVYNGEDRDIDLAGLVFENVTKAAKCTIPKGFAETVVPARGYKLLWADNEPERGPLHLSFKLAATVPETVSLTIYYRDSLELLSSLTYEPHSSGLSFGRIADGHDSLTLFDECVGLDGNNVFTATPLAPNGSVACEMTSAEQTLANGANLQICVYGRNIVLQNIDKDCRVEIFSLLGTKIASKTANSDVAEVSVPAPGLYIVKVGPECRKVVVK